jgi:molecular chaperone DnaJ
VARVNSLLLPARTLKIGIPAGVNDGTKLRIEGEGEVGSAEGPTGDLYVIVRLAKHVFFEREDHNLFCQVSISFSQAALGVSIEIPNLDQEIDVLKIPPGTQSGEMFRLKGRGIRDLHTHRKGDLYVKVQVNTPQSLSKEEKALLRQLAELRGEDLDKADRSLIDKVKNIIH